MSEIKFHMRPVSQKRIKVVERKSIYDPIIDQFINSGHDLVEIEVEEKNPNYIATSLNKRIQARGLSIVASAAGGFAYLEKTQN